MPTLAGANNATHAEINAIIDGGVNVDHSGATGDGSTNDNDAIDTAITAAGVNGKVIFTAGKTYIIDRVLNPLAGQTWVGYGATLKKADMVSTLLTGGGSGGVWPVTPGEGTNFREGSEVTIWDTPDETDHATQVKTVLGVAANSITLANDTFTGITAASGDQLETACRMIESNAADVKILGLTIDGNGADYSAGLHAWELHEDIRLTGDRSVIQHVKISDSQLEAILASGDGTQIINNWIISPGGNAVHLSASDGLIVDGNYMFDSQVYNTDNANHQDGAISISNDVVSGVISNNYYDGNSNGLAFVAGLDETTENLTVIGNHAHDATTYAVELLTAPANNTSNHTITGNYFNTMGEFVFNDTGDNKRIKNISITNNVIVSTDFVINNVDGYAISGNVLDSVAFQILDSANGVVSGNTITANNAGILMSIDSGGAGLLTDLLIDGNIIKGHTANANMIAILAEGNDASGITLNNNKIISGANVNNVFSLLVRANDVNVSNNYFDITAATASGNVAIHWDGNFATGGGSLRNNYVVTAENPGWVETNADNVSVIGNHFISTGSGKNFIFQSDNNYINGNHFENCDLDIRGTDNTVTGNLVTTENLIITATADTNFVDGNRVEGTGATITIASGATNNVVTNNATTAALSDSGTGTVTTSQNHTIP